jgi:rhodanese-related sulfurtransferase
MRWLSIHLSPFVIAILALVACATAPPARHSIGNLSAEQLKGLLDRKASLFLVDTRTEYEFKQGRIPGSVNIPPHKFPPENIRNLGTLLPADKSTHLVFYCRGAA